MKNTWIEKDKVLDAVLTEPFNGGHIHLINCFVGKLVLMGGFSEHLVIENCIIKEYDCLGVHFNGQVVIRNSIFLEKFIFSDGGHNKEEVFVEGNIFNCFADFCDEYFTAKVTFKNNIFLRGTNLLADIAGETVIFESGSEIDNNVGRLDSSN